MTMSGPGGPSNARTLKVTNMKHQQVKCCNLATCAYNTVVKALYEILHHDPLRKKSTILLGFFVKYWGPVADYNRNVVTYLKFSYGHVK